MGGIAKHRVIRGLAQKAPGDMVVVGAQDKLALDINVAQQLQVLAKALQNDSDAWRANSRSASCAPVASNSVKYTIATILVILPVAAAGSTSGSNGCTFHVLFVSTPSSIPPSIHPSICPSVPAPLCLSVRSMPFGGC